MRVRSSPFSRRRLFKAAVPAGLAAAVPPRRAFAADGNRAEPPPARAITRGPKHHWFGYCSYLPGNQWILNDTYPDGQRRQHVYLYHVATGRRVPLGDFASPAAYQGEWRCDTHPRSSPDGRGVIIDSPRAGEGRQMCLIDVSRIVG